MSIINLTDALLGEDRLTILSIVDNVGYIKADGTVGMTIGYTPTLALHIATKEYVDGVSHNNLQNIQGGAATDYQHLTTAELTKLTNIEAGATADQVALEVPYTNTTSGLTATDVQTAIDEVEGRVDTIESSGYLVSSDIGSTVQAYDVDTTKNDLANIFTAPQRTSIAAEDNAIDFTTQNNFNIPATAANITALNVDNCVGQSGVIKISSAENIIGWGTEFVFKNGAPAGLTGIEIFAYFIDTTTTIRIGRLV